jgi:hypothetical protein
LFHTFNLKTVDTIKKNYAAGQKKQYGPRIVGEILHDYLENSNEPLAVAYRECTTESEKQGWHSNTDLGCDLKTILRSDVRMKTGKEYQGVLRLDSEGIVDEFLYRDPHYTFIETAPPTAGKRNLHLFVGQHITVTRRDDGSLRPNFKPMKVDKDFSVAKYASGVANELLWALEGLIENGMVEEESK